MALIATGVLAFLLPTVMGMGYMYEFLVAVFISQPVNVAVFQRKNTVVALRSNGNGAIRPLFQPILVLSQQYIPDTSRESYSLGDDVTLTCPVTLFPDEDYKYVEWTYFSCGRYHFKNYCYTRARWNKATYSGPKDIALTNGIAMQVPADRSVKATLTIKKITCAQSAYYHCRVVGTKGTNREHRHDVYLFRNASVEPRLTPNPIIVPGSGEGYMFFTCVDEAHVPGSSVRMYYGTWGWRAVFHEVPTQCSVIYEPDKCYEVATCMARIKLSTLRNRQTLQNSVHCDITRPGGKRVAILERAQINRRP